MTENEKHIIDYYESHDIGDEGIISALEVPREDAIEYHKVELYKQKSSIGIMLR